MDKNFMKALQQDLSAPEGTAFPIQDGIPSSMNKNPLPNERNIDEDLEEFKQAFPNVYTLALSNSQCIPKEVWAMVRDGMSLTEAFQAWLDKQQPQNLRNARRSAGSMRSAGRNTAISDPFLRGFHAND